LHAEGDRRERRQQVSGVAARQANGGHVFAPFCFDGYCMFMPKAMAASDVRRWRA
jgi:hypothetical protein